MTRYEHCKPTFAKLSQDKQDRILRAAIAEFASHGFAGANVNAIAERAHISIGSLYNYFASKEDLFLTIVEMGRRILEEALEYVSDRGGDIFDRLEMIFRSAQAYAKRYVEFNQIYLNFTSEGLAHLSSRLSQTMEAITAQYYVHLFDEGKSKGIVDPEIDPQMASFCIDNIVLMLQFSYTNAYYRERMKIFLGSRDIEDDDRVIDGIMTLVRKALGPPS